MPYELTQELKKAGLPALQHTSCNKCEYDTRHGNYHVPTLEELVDACGEDLWTLKRVIGPKGKKGWIVGRDASQDKDHTEWEKLEFDETLIIAVANLYLALHPLSASEKENE